MIIDTDDPATLAHLNPMERQILRNVADRLAMVAWQRVGYMGERGLPPDGSTMATSGRSPATR